METGSEMETESEIKNESQMETDSVIRFQIVSSDFISKVILFLLISSYRCRRYPVR